MIGESPAFLEVLEHASCVAPLNRPVLVIGERGTGKELIAARIHYLSGRWDQPLVKMNCAALAESLLETELFGHEAGSFTGAKRRRVWAALKRPTKAACSWMNWPTLPPACRRKSCA